MQCPACNHVDHEAAFGKPAKCPRCGAFYDKAVIARARKAEALYQAAEREERKRKVEAVAGPAKQAASLGRSVFLTFISSKLFGRAVLVVAVLGIIVFLVARPASGPAAPTAKAGQPNEYAVIRVGQRAVESRLKDAESAKFRNQFVGKSGIPCGEVNARNGFGGYNGFKRYIASGGGVSVIEGEIPSDQFEETWQRFCAR